MFFISFAFETPHPIALQRFEQYFAHERDTFFFLPQTAHSIVICPMLFIIGKSFQLTKVYLSLIKFTKVVKSFLKNILDKKNPRILAGGNSVNREGKTLVFYFYDFKFLTKFLVESL